MITKRKENLMQIIDEEYFMKYVMKSYKYFTYSNRFLF